jgi:DNA mismatch repair protein PMS2
LSNSILPQPCSLLPNCFDVLNYRFETLQRTTAIHQQPLIIPLNLEVSASEELIIIENVNTFESNGFRLKIDENAACGRRIQLLSVPFSKHIQFGVEDVRELASLIGDSQGGDGGSYISKLMLKNDRIDFKQATESADTYRVAIGEKEGTQGTNVTGTVQGPDSNSILSGSHSVPQDHLQGESKRSRVGERAPEDTESSTSQNLLRIPKLVSMFASRACRSSIMIGTAMQESEMKTVVGRLEKIDQPWNCPHGRPTMRHLVDLVQVRKKRKVNPICDLSRFVTYISDMADG